MGLFDGLLKKKEEKQEHKQEEQVSTPVINIPVEEPKVETKAEEVRQEPKAEETNKLGLFDNLKVQAEETKTVAEQNLIQAQQKLAERQAKVEEVKQDVVIKFKNRPDVVEYEDLDIVELKNIRQVYNEGFDDEMTIFDGTLNLLIKDVKNRGQFATILGESGCGKSTILNYISGLKRPTSGEILVSGRPQTEKDRAGMVFQKYTCYPWKRVIDYVMLPLLLKGVKKKEAYERAMDMIIAAGLEKHKDKWAQDGILSGGQLQRVAIAASLVANQKLLLMDEPFGALDNRTRSEMQDRLLQIWMSIEPTILMVTHDIREAVYLSDEIYVMKANPGAIIERIEIKLDKADKLVKRSPEFLNYVNHIDDLMMSLRK